MSALILEGEGGGVVYSYNFWTTSIFHPKAQKFQSSYFEIISDESICAVFHIIVNRFWIDGQNFENSGLDFWEVLNYNLKIWKNCSE